MIRKYMSYLRAVVLLVSLLVFTHSVAIAGGQISGQVLRKSGEAILDAKIQILPLNRQTKVDREGRFGFTDLEPGEYLLRVSAREFGSKIWKTVVQEGQTTEVEFSFDVAIHEELVVSASPGRKSISDVSQAIGVLGEEELDQRMQASLGETLEGEPGVRASFFGPAASRPIIRGLGGDRIRILEGGIETGDASSVSADHALTLDTFTTERIEVLRGPASLRYGSSAVGGVVNVLDNRIPEFLPTEPLSGSVLLRGDTVAGERTGAFGLDGSLGRLAWHLDFSDTDSGDYEIPASPDIDPDHAADEPFSGKQTSSDLSRKKGALGLTYIGDRGFVGVSYTGLDTNYGIPGESHEHESDAGEAVQEAEEETVRIDMNQKRVDLRAGINFGNSFFKTMNIRFGSTDYDHAELEGQETGTQFNNRYKELRAEAVHDQWGPFTSGSIGMQFSDRDFEAVGEEAFVPPNQTERLGGYGYEEIERTDWSMSLGVRVERQTNVAEPFAVDESENETGPAVTAQSLSFNAMSASIGFVLGRNSNYGFAANLAHTERAPTAEELFANGPHLATGAFEVGDPNLKKERSFGLDLVFRKKAGRVNGELTIFANHFNDFVFEQFSGRMVDDLNEYQFIQEDADFQGGEIHLDTALIHTDPHHLTLEFSYDFVRAELSDSGNLPRIPADSLTVALSYKQPNFWAKTEYREIADQNRIGQLETATQGYSRIDAALGLRLFLGTGIHQVMLRGTNLTDEEARVHTSFLKNSVLLPGRNLTFSYRLSF